YVASFASARVRSDGHCFDDTKWEEHEQVAVFKRSGFGFVSVADEIVRACRFPRHGFPFSPCRKCCATTAHQLRIQHLLDDPIGSNLKCVPECGEFLDVIVRRKVVRAIAGLKHLHRLGLNIPEESSSSDRADIVT